jgi:hypothetical protein
MVQLTPGNFQVQDPAGRWRRSRAWLVSLYHRSVIRGQGRGKLSPPAAAMMGGDYYKMVMPSGLVAEPGKDLISNSFPFFTFSDF